ncbi:MAG TPA: tRNA (guanosine(46)-N7)-methyltransferase TrmB [Gammaproteobacteria bacterium]|nr:tRNA (guanosine(46)-N7)-methyltransferase TrmB [Gammaproteobacteria bacterium]
MNDKFITLLTDPQRTIHSYALRRGRGALKNIKCMKDSNHFLSCEKQIHEFNASNYQKVVCEVGFGMGESLLVQAINNPHIFYLGIEVHLDGVLQLSHGIEENCCHNLKIIYGDACYVLGSLIPPKALDCVQLFFPDPWPKTKHHKRRILRLELLDAIKRSLNNSGTIHMCTDWAPYATEMIESVQLHHDFEIQEHSVNAPIGQRELTKYEKRGQKMGHDIHDLLIKLSQDC